MEEWMMYSINKAVTDGQVREIRENKTNDDLAISFHDNISHNSIQFGAAAWHWQFWLHSFALKSKLKLQLEFCPLNWQEY